MLSGISVLALGLTSIVAANAQAADLPKATQKVLADLKLDASILNGLDDELKVPQAWLDGASKGAGVVILGTWKDDEFRRMTTAFNERYPSVKLAYTRAGTAARGIKVILALREDRAIADVLMSPTDSYVQLKKMNALADLRELPGFKNMDSKYAAADGTWASYKLAFRCMAYNTAKVKQADLPKTWDDLLTNPVWKNGNLAISNYPDTWLLALWTTKGEAWGQDFTRRLFTEVVPQQRKEGMMAVTALSVAGEFYANQPAPERRAQEYSDKGAPISYHCPDPVPITLSQIVMLDKAKQKDGARLFINWLMSSEGQVMQFATSNSIPVHKGLQSSRFVPFAETTLNKPTVVRDEEMLGSDLDKTMLKVWNSYWTQPVEQGKREEE
jgi:ABC-type Fe3+ transport system substrate-binding protein